jgi:hypothetical protein
MIQENVSRRIQEAFDNPQILQDALAKGVQDARRQYSQAGLPMATWNNGRVVWIDPITFQEVERPNLPVLPAH